MCGMLKCFINFVDMETIINEQNIDELLSAGQPLVIDFWAPWCGPCRMLGPVIEEIAAEYDGRLLVGKCNVDDCEDLASRFGIRNIPSVLFIKAGVVVDRTAGLVAKQDLVAKAEALL